MDDIIIFGIIAASVVFNIVRNYKKEEAKNSKRVIGQPNTSPNKPLLETLTSQNTAKKATPSKVELFKKREPAMPTKQEEVVEKAYHDNTKSSFDNSKEEAEAFDDAYTLPREDLLFESGVELRKAILYSAILERKF